MKSSTGREKGGVGAHSKAIEGSSGLAEGLTTVYGDDDLRHLKVEDNVEDDVVVHLRSLNSE